MNYLFSLSPRTICITDINYSNIFNVVILCFYLKISTNKYHVTLTYFYHIFYSVVFHKIYRNLITYIKRKYSFQYVEKFKSHAHFSSLKS